MAELEELKNIITNFNNVSIGVIGDMVADKTILGRPVKLSREAPVIVVRQEAEHISPGGAGNTMNNISKLNAKVFPVCVVGNDEPGKKLLKYFSDDENVDANGIFINFDGNTITKTRILAGDTYTTKQQVIRIDNDEAGPLPEKLENEILSRMNQLNKLVDVWVVSDYGYNMVTGPILSKIKDFSKDKVVVADSRNRLIDFKGVSIAAPNESEVEIVCNETIGVNNDIFAIGKKLLTEMATDALLITRGNQGMILFEKGGNITDIPICGSKEVSDVTGAGDTVTSILALSYACGAKPAQAAKLSNYGAAIVVMKNGTATLTQSELVEIIEKDIC